ncbi:hypothetical protein [Neisseria sp. Ec49-e6-T10]|uniref:hypothetical protein n=1 Tax=Neisseria sp. Ec49-e6-T10 TaxID=3140744 RepID=UPI003EBFBEBB
MQNNEIMKALFIQQRFLILNSIYTSDFMPEAYVYAWEVGVFPYLDDEDDDNLYLAHSPYKNFFNVEEEMVLKIVEYLDEKFINEEPITFYELESTFGGKSNRVPLMHVCRYVFLKGLFDEEFWKNLVESEKTPAAPIEAKSIIKPYSKPNYI